MNKDLAEAPINSRPWWDAYFEAKWDSYGGSDQTRYFMETLLSHLPEPEKAFLSAGSRTILDWGCAFGEGVAKLAETFPESRVTGLDFSQTAIHEARVRNPGYEFIWSEAGAIPRDFDVIVTSNCLEHFEQPLASIEQHLATCWSLYILLVPYNECPLHPQHRAQFRVESFPSRIRDFRRIHAEPLAVDEHFWPGQQLLVVYASESYLDEARNRPDTMALAVARIEALLGPERQRAAEARGQRERAEKEQERADREQRRAEGAEAFLKTEWEAWEITAYAARQELRQTSQTLRDIIAGIQRYQVEFEKYIALYRGERAWWIMAAIRKAYVMLARQKFAGILPTIRWAVKVALGKGGADLKDFEPVFPHLLNFVSKELVAPEPSPPAQRPKRKAIQPPKPERLYDVVVLPIFDFDFRFQRPQQIAVQFARKGHRVFWISPTRMLPLSSATPYKAIPIRENLWEIHLRAAPFDLYRGALQPVQAAARIEALAGLYRDMDLGSSCAILQFPFWRQIGLGLREQFGARLIYDCMDDWQNWPTEPLPSAFNLTEEKKLAREADVLVVTSRGLRDRYAADQIDSVLIPNAADFEFFRDAPEDSSLADLPRPVIGYYGAIADWFDLELMVEVIRSRPQYTFVLIGQVHVSGVSALEALPNAHLLGEKPYSELPGYLRRFEVCTLPFRMNRLTQAVDPVKIYEYLSQGKPVVSVPLPELTPLSELLYFAAGPEEFSRQIDRALAETDDAVRRKRIAFASGNTWTSRGDTLDRAVRRRFLLVSLLVVTYNSREFFQPFFDSLRRNTAYPCYEVIVVDNHSNDGSAADLERYAQADPRIRLHCLQENLGFAAGNNFAARMAQGEYLVLLNPDTMLTAGWLERLMRPIENDSRIGMVAPVTNFSGNETKINADYLWASEMAELAAQRRAAKFGETFEIDVIPLFCALLRRKLWDEVGGLDESFKVGTFEDDDFSLRVRKAGYRLVTAEDCFVHHFGNGSFGKLQTEAFQRIFDQNRKRFESKWGVTWLPHKTRPGVRPVSFEDSRISVSKFLEEDSGSGN